MDSKQPVFLSINSHDPSGGAGLVADVETATSLGCHCVSAITALNVRDTKNLKDRQSSDTALMIEQVRAALEDCPIAAIKVGDIATIAQAEAIHTILGEYSNIKVVLDPVLHHGADDGDVDAAVRLLLLPRATFTVLSTEHIQQLSTGGDSVNAYVQQLLEFGCEHLLVTGIKGENDKLINRLFSTRGIDKEYSWDLLPQSFHGAGSTLSAAITAYLAHGFDLLEALQQGQQFTWQALANAQHVGQGCLIPDRLFWCRRSDS
ncbi:MAG TPA: hydroxymethylpyrimidine/phosphomethylpyrimidine kinase [Spongiibacteraceae bacterium]|nr:hydroxymethylpyrimidine/phosphomethylpyrimidine kinase [Spongiibacteraceae bacterium]